MTGESFPPEIAEYLKPLVEATEDGFMPEGMILDGWWVTARIGVGGFSDVYRVVRDGDGAVASLKLLREVSEASCRRFEFECELLVSARTMALPKYVAKGEFGGRPYVVTELLEPMEIPETETDIAEYVLKVCECVRALHASGVVHRDIKPQNVMRRANGEIVLIDLGLAKEIGHAPFSEGEVSVVEGRVVAAGTPGYGAPEQFLGGKITPQTDIHALGMLLYTCLVRSMGEELVHRRWQYVVQRAICSVPEERYESIDEFMKAIRDRGHRRAKRIAWMALAVLALSGWWATTIDWVYAYERVKWRTMCEHVTTNVVSQALIREQVTTQQVNGVAFARPIRWYRSVTNAVKAVRIDLRKRNLTFNHPICLVPGWTYYIEGPGRLDAALALDGSPLSMATDLHLARCVVLNRMKGSIANSGIRYHLDGGAYLNFTEIASPDSVDYDWVEMSDGMDNQLRFMGPESAAALRKTLRDEAERRLMR